MSRTRTPREVALYAAMSNELARLADEAGMSYAEIARRTGMSARLVSDRLSGNPRRLTTTELLVIGLTLGVKPSDVVRVGEAAAR